jgi:hypothetical protein
MNNLNQNEEKEVCVFCNNPFKKRPKGDHVVPQGLGIFRPEFTLNNVCEECDNRHGYTFERVVLQTGVMGLVRLRNQIKSKNNKKGKPHNPFFDDKYGNKSGKFSISKIGDESIVPSFSDDGTVYSAQEIRLLKNGQTDRIISIPPEHDISTICTFIAETYSANKSEYQIELRLNNFQAESIFKELEIRGIKLGQVARLPREERYEIFHVSSEISEDHLRFMSSIALKAMLYCGYSSALLHHLLNYTDKDIKYHDSIATVNAIESNIDFRKEPELNQLYHYFEWEFTQNRILIRASFLAQGNNPGLRFFFNFPQGTSDEIIIPFGSILLKYGKTNKDGHVYLKKGNKEIV